MAITLESDLYGPIKGYLEGIGYTVRGEVGQCDALAIRGEEVVAVEMKLALGLPVIYQALERLSSVDVVYIAVAVPDGYKARSNWDDRVPAAARLCKMLGVGLLCVRDDRVVVISDPAPYSPRKQPKLRARLLGEFHGRSGDHNLGGTSKRPRVTAYREKALRMARVLAQIGPIKASLVRDATGFANASNTLRDNVYGYFGKVSLGVYEITEVGRQALLEYADVVQTQDAMDARAAAESFSSGPSR